MQQPANLGALKIAPELLADVLHLPASAAVVGSCFDGGCIVLTVADDTFPACPLGSDVPEIEATFTRQEPVVLTTWRVRTNDNGEPGA